MLRRSTDHLAARGSTTPRLDAELLLGHALGLARIELYLEFDRPLLERELAACRTLIARRARHEPVAYILGVWGFRRLTLAVDARALIPRPETEIVVERCLALLAGTEAPAVLDVGTGTGAIALALVDEQPGTRATGIDVSPAALALAAENRERTGLAVDLVQHDLREGLPAGPWQLVVANPPYVTPAELPGLMPDVRDWEPHLALVGVGLAESIAESALAVLALGGALVLEVGETQTEATAERLRALGYREVRITLDLSGKPRVVEGIR